MSAQVWLWATGSTGIQRQIGAVAVTGQTYFALPVSLSGTSTVDAWSAGQTLVVSIVTVLTTATAIVAANTARRAITITNTDPARTLYIGPTGVTVATGTPIGPMASGTFSSSAAAAWFGISDGPSNINTRVLEERT